MLVFVFIIGAAHELPLDGVKHRDGIGHPLIIRTNFNNYLKVDTKVG